MSHVRMPTPHDLPWPTLKALEANGGSASNGELSEQITVIARLPDAIIDMPHQDGPMSEVDFRTAWARTDLRLMGAVENSA